MDANFKLRYYAPAFERPVHAETLRLLEDVKVKYGISYEVQELRYKEGINSDSYVVDESDEKAAYEKDFLPRKSVLKNRIGEPVSRLLRSRSGGYFLGGTVAIVRNGQVEWFTNYAVPFKEDSADPGRGFLRALLRKGPMLLEQLTPVVQKGQPELALIDAFMASGTLHGKFEREVRIGQRVHKTDRGTFDYRKSIDIVCQTGGETWILEAKTRLNYEALGEVLTYALLYAGEHPAEEIKRGIVCGVIDEDVLMTCKEGEVSVFQVVGDKVISH